MSSKEGLVKLGLIGAGNMANAVHYPSLAEFKDVQMVALCDVVEEKLNDTAKRFDIGKKYVDYERMIDQEKLDAVYILMPPHKLFDLVIDCLDVGLDVFIEKPPAVTAFQVKAMARKAQEKDAIGMTGFNRRYIPIMRQVKRQVEEQGKVNQVVSTFYKQGEAVYYDGAIDALSCDAIHAVDTLRWLAGGEVEQVASLVKRYDDVTPNAWNALISFDNGVSGVLLANWNVGGRVHQFEVHAPGMSAFVEPDVEGRLVTAEGVEELDPFQIAGSEENYKYYGFYDESRHFIDCLKSREEPSSSFADAVKTMELVEKIKQCNFT